MSRDFEPASVERVDCLIIQLQQWFATRADDERFRVRPTRLARRGRMFERPKCRYRVSKAFRIVEPATIGTDADKIRITECADCGRTIRLSSCPEVAA